jgi:hypothetical protein
MFEEKRKNVFIEIFKIYYKTAKGAKRRRMV